MKFRINLLTVTWCWRQSVLCVSADYLKMKQDLFFFNLYQDSGAAFTSMSFIWNRKKILWPEDKCSSLLRHLSWWRWNPSWRKRVIVFSVVEDGPSNETRVHESELQKAAGSLTGKMNPRVPVAALGHSIGQAFNQRPHFEICRVWIIAHARTYATLWTFGNFWNKTTWRKASQTNGNCSSRSLSWSLHWLGSLWPLCRAEDCILRTLYSEIMGPLIGWPVTEWLVV